jgi:predicted nucleic acid-binding protein
VFLEAALGQEKASECQLLLSEIANGRIEASVSHFTIHAIEAVLARGDKMLDFVRAIEGSKGLTVSESTISDELTAAILTGKIGRDFDDSLQYFMAKKIGAKYIVSFDTHFDSLDIPRRSPSEVLSLKKVPLKGEAMPNSHRRHC